MSKEYKADLQEVLSDPENYKLLIILILFTFMITVIHLFPMIILSVSAIKELFENEKDQQLISNNLIGILLILAFIRLAINIVSDKGIVLNITFFIVSGMLYGFLLSNQSNKLYMYILELFITSISFYRLLPSW